MSFSLEIKLPPNYMLLYIFLTHLHNTPPVHSDGFIYKAEVDWTAICEFMVYVHREHFYLKATNTMPVVQGANRDYRFTGDYVKEGSKKTLYMTAVGKRYHVVNLLSSNVAFSRIFMFCFITHGFCSNALHFLLQEL